MKTSHGSFPFAGLAVAGVWMILSVNAGSLDAAGGAGVGAAAAGGGGHGGGGVAASGGGHASVTSSGGMRAGGGLSTGGLRSSGGSLRPMTASYSGQPHYLSGGFTPNVFPNHASITSVGGSRGYVVAPAGSAGQTTVAAARTAPTAPAARVHNAWTDTIDGAAGAGRNANNFSGTVLYPNAGRGVPGDRYQARPGNYAGNGNGRHEYGYRDRRLGYGGYGPYGYGYPGVLINGYDPYFYGDTVGGLADPDGDYAMADVPDNSVANSNAPSPAADAALSQPNATATIQPPALNPAEDDASQAAQPQAPTGSSGKNIRSNNGPDSLVEAVQAELSRRGYYGGKIDAVYNDATHTAIQRFQKDQQLPASGRINEATLHALQLD